MLPAEEYAGFAGKMQACCPEIFRPQAKFVHFENSG